MHYYKFNIADWVNNTAHLSLKEEAILLRLINYYINTERCIPKKTQLVLRKLRLADESDSVEILLEEFFEKRSDGYHIEELDKIINEYQARAEKNRKNGKSGGRPKINNLDKATGLPDANQVDTEMKPTGNLNYKPLTTNEELLITNEESLTTNKEIKKDKLDWSALQMSESEIDEIKKLRKNAKATITQRVINSLAKEFEISRKRGYTNDDIMNEWSIKGWRSYKDDWMKVAIKKPIKTQAKPENYDPLKGLLNL